MTEPIFILVVGLCIGVVLGNLLLLLYPRIGKRKPRGRYDSRQPKQPLAADLIRYSRWRNEQIERALRDEPPYPY